jgi:hypothetical protein
LFFSLEDVLFFYSGAAFKPLVCEKENGPKLSSQNPKTSSPALEIPHTILTKVRIFYWSLGTLLRPSGKIGPSATFHSGQETV